MASLFRCIVSKMTERLIVSYQQHTIHVSTYIHKTTQHARILFCFQCDSCFSAIGTLRTQKQYQKKPDDFSFALCSELLIQEISEFVPNNSSVLQAFKKYFLAA